MAKFSDFHYIFLCIQPKKKPYKQNQTLPKGTSTYNISDRQLFFLGGEGAHGEEDLKIKVYASK